MGRDWAWLARGGYICGRVEFGKGLGVVREGRIHMWEVEFGGGLGMVSEGMIYMYVGGGVWGRVGYG